MNLKARFGARLQELREAAGLTQQELSARSGLDAATLSRIERGKRNVTLETFSSLLLALRVSPRTFFSSEDFGTVSGLPGESQDFAESDWLAFREARGGLTASFPCGKFEASHDFPLMARSRAVEVVLALRRGLRQAGIIDQGGSGVEGEAATALMSKAIAEAFLNLAHLYPLVNPSDIWRYLIYRAFLDPGNHPSASRRKSLEQSWKRTSGWAVERIVAMHYGPFLEQRGIRITSLTSNAERAPILAQMGLSDKVVPDKADQFLLGLKGAATVPFGVIHVKASVAERRTDDVPASRAIMAAGYLSVFVTMDAKDTPSPRPINRGEYGRPGPAASDKRKDIEVHGHFSAAFSFNSNTTESPPETPSGCRIMHISLADPDDPFTRLVRSRWALGKQRKHPQ